MLIFDSKVIQICLKAILGGEAGVYEEAFDLIPLFKASVVEKFQIVLDDEGHNVVFQALFKEDQAAYIAQGT